MSHWSLSLYSLFVFVCSDHKIGRNTVDCGFYKKSQKVEGHHITMVGGGGLAVSRGRSSKPAPGLAPGCNRVQAGLSRLAPVSQRAQHPVEIRSSSHRLIVGSSIIVAWLDSSSMVSHLIWLHPADNMCKTWVVCLKSIAHEFWFTLIIS